MDLLTIGIPTLLLFPAVGFLVLAYLDGRPTRRPFSLRRHAPNMDGLLRSPGILTPRTIRQTALD